jgi:hypothetical protein
MPSDQSEPDIIELAEARVREKRFGATARGDGRRPTVYSAFTSSPTAASGALAAS